MFHKTFKRAVYIAIGACVALGLVRPPVTASAATTQDSSSTEPVPAADLYLDPTASTAQAEWQSQQAGTRFASWSSVFMAPPR